MRPRQSLIEIFSTFLQFVEDRVSGWISIPRLRRSIEHCLQQLPEAKSSEQFWALYWHKIWQQQSSSLAREHLSSYLQETCYWAAQKIVTSLTNTQYRLSDCFQIGITELDKILQGFKSERGFSLKSYASATFRGVIIDTLRQRQEADFCSDWILLHKLSQKRLQNSLIHAGVNSDKIERYWLAWICFKTLYIPKPTLEAHQLILPDRTTWLAIAKLYNTERISQLTSPGPECSPETLEHWLTHCSKWVRSYLYPQVTSLNQPQPGKESGEIIDNLPLEQESLLTQMMVQEETQHRDRQKNQLYTVLTTALNQLQPQAQQLLQLYYGQGQTQQQIAQRFNMKQYTVSRHISKACESLLQALVNWSQQTLHVSLTSTVLKDMSAVLEEWLQDYYEQPDHIS